MIFNGTLFTVIVAISAILALNALVSIRKIKVQGQTEWKFATCSLKMNN